MSGLDGRRVLVTGGSSGIGAATARAVVAEGGRVVVIARRTDALAALAAELEPAAVPLTCDITDDRQVEETVATAAGTLGGLDAVVNAAGTFAVGPVADTDPRAWRAMYEVNVLGLLSVVRAAVPHLRAGTAPAVVNISSMSGRRVPNPLAGVYASTKFAVHALGEALRQQLAPAGIRVCTVAPGFVDTPITEGWPDSEHTREFRRRLAEDGLAPEVVADAVVHVLGRPAGVTVVEYAVLSVRQ